MLDMEQALELMKKYGYSSTTVHPYLYQSGESVGICYTYLDEDYGNLERIKIFDSLEEFEEFLKQLDWLKKNGLNYHVRMCLDNYEAINPKTLFLRNEKLMIEGEMDDIEAFDARERQRDQMDEASKILYEAGDLLLIYDEVKKRQLQYLLKIIGLKNQLREKYFNLQKSVDEYNKVKIEREMVKIPEVPDSGGIDLTMEIALKDRYNVYIHQVPSLEEITSFLKEVWDLNKNLELNARYYDALREETEIRNEMKIVEKKQELMDKLNDELKPLFGVDLVGRFRKINRSFGYTTDAVSKDLVTETARQVEDKYAVYPKLDLLFVSDYLREAIQNTNYEDLAIKYGKGTTRVIAERGRTPLNEIASSLLVQYKNSLSIDEQAILVIYSNPKFRKICDAILNVPKFNTFTPKQIIKKIGGIKGFSKLKSECYISLKNRIDDPLNNDIKNSLFKDYDFTTFETFIASLMRELGKLALVNNKMRLTGDMNMYISVKKVEDINKPSYLLVTNDLNTLLEEAKESKSMIGITLLKTNLPVLYSPYFLDLGDIYDKNASPKLEIREMINFELLIDMSDVLVNIDKTKVRVNNFYSELTVEGNVSVARDIKSAGKTVFVKYALLPNTQVLGEAPVVEAQPVEMPNNVSTADVAPQVAIPDAAFTSKDNYQAPAVEVSEPVQEPVQTVPEQPVNINESAEQMMEAALAGGSMVAMASQEANNVAVPEEPVEVPPTEEEIPNVSIEEPKEETSVDEPVEGTPEVESPEEEQPMIKPFEGETSEEGAEIEEPPVVPLAEEKQEEDKAPDLMGLFTTPEEPKIDPLDLINEEQPKEEQPVQESDKSEGPDNEIEVESVPSDDDEDTDDLDKFLDTLSTNIPKDLTNNLEDTNNMELFSDIKEKEESEEPASEEKSEVSEEKPEDKTPEVPEENKEEQHDEEHQEEKKLEEDSKEGQPEENKEPVKQQLIKKIITNPDGTKKTVIVRRIIKPAAAGSSSTGKTVKRIVKKIGVPDSGTGKKVVVKRIIKKVPKKESVGEENETRV